MGWRRSRLLATPGIDASAAARALCGPGPFPNITGSTTFAPGVTCVNNINTTKATFTFAGTASDRYVINVVGPGVSGVHVLNNLKTVLNGQNCGEATQTGVCPNQILWNFTAPGTTVSFFKPDATLAGSVLVPDGSFIQDHGALAGTVCAGCTAKFHSGAFVSCPNP